MVSRVLTSKCHGTDLSQGSRIQIRANGSGCLTRDTKDIVNEDHQDSTCPLNRQHVIRSNYMAKSIEAKKKVRGLINRIGLRQISSDNFHYDNLMQCYVCVLHVYEKYAVSSPRGVPLLGNRGIWSECRKKRLLRCTLGREIFIGTSWLY